MIGILTPLSGHFYECEWIEWDNSTKTYKTPISFRIKGQSQIGVSSGMKETIQVFENSRPVQKEVLKVNTVADLPFKLKDRVRFKQDDKVFVIVKISEDFNHPNSIKALFTSVDVPKILYLGDM